MWLDAGTFDNLTNCNILVSQICQRQGQDFGCIEEAAIQSQLISPGELGFIIKEYPDNEYKKYIQDLIV